MAFISKRAFTSSYASSRQLFFFPFLQKFRSLAQFYFLQNYFSVHSQPCFAVKASAVGFLESLPVLRSHRPLLLPVMNPFFQVSRIFGSRDKED